MEAMTVLIIGKEDDLTSAYVKQKVEARGVPAYFFETTRYPYEIRLSYDIEDPLNGTFQQTPYDPVIPLGEIRSVFRRWSDGVRVPEEEQDPLTHRLVYRNLESAINTFFASLKCRWVNTHEATELHRKKGFLLQRLKSAGYRVPETLITNNPDDARAFYEKMNGEAIIKPVFGWASTERVTPAHLTDESLSRLSLMPVKMQEMIPGRDLRIYVIGEEVFAMEIRTDALDFRDDAGAPRVAVELPDDVKKRCIEITRLLELVFCGIDMRRTPDGEHVFFEGNPTPVFILDEETSGHPISDRLVDLLLS